MNKKIFTFTVLFIIVLLFSFAILSQKDNSSQSLTEKSKNNQTENQIILFYGEGCPHCEIVEEYIEENDIEDKLSFVQKEVYSNSENSKELKEKAGSCGLPSNSIGVPFLWDGEECLIGDQKVINFFESEIEK